MEPSASIRYISKLLAAMPRGGKARSQWNAILPVAGGAGIDRHPEANTTGSRASIATVHTITAFFTSETPLFISQP